jgi:hypothetical protein
VLLVSAVVEPWQAADATVAAAAAAGGGAAAGDDDNVGAGDSASGRGDGTTSSIAYSTVIAASHTVHVWHMSPRSRRPTTCTCRRTMQQLVSGMSCSQHARAAA